jgi:hypothetical protein
MSVEAVPGGQRRIDRVLDPGFTDGSTHRQTVQRVVDVLRGELARRYRDGTAQVSQLLEMVGVERLTDG